MFKFIDDFLNKITMYRLTIYSLFFLLCAGLVFSLFKLVPVSPVSLLFSTALLTVACLLINQIFAYFYEAPSNIESVYITAWILALIISPSISISGIIFIICASFFAMGSKYVLAINKKHLFNPAAFAVVATALVISQYASWWIGTLFMAPLVFVVGFLITRKIKRWDLVLAFFITAFVVIWTHGFLAGQDLWVITRLLVIDSSLMFFAFIMLTEPATSPPTRNLRIAYGILTGFLFSLFTFVNIPITGIIASPELALVLANIFSYLVSPKEKLILILKEKIKIAADTYDFVFKSNRKLAFEPGQYLEWTLAHEKQDTRGMRRYFTIASSPTEQDIRMGVKFYPKPSSYKVALESLNEKNAMVASQLAGDFTLPKNTGQKLVFIAGGIGVTPFRSMVKYLIDKNERRDIVIFYANSNFDDIAYRDIFDEAEKKLGIKTIYIINDLINTPADFKHETGRVSQKMITSNVTDYQSRVFYISGPRSMITSFEKTLQDMGVPKNHIKTDFFPGFA